MMTPDLHAHAVRNELANLLFEVHRRVHNAGGHLGDALITCAEVEALAGAARRALLELPEPAEVLPPIEAEQPCFKCGRTGPLVVDRFPQRPDMRNYPERFMHASGLCPESPDR